MRSKLQVLAAAAVMSLTALRAVAGPSPGAVQPDPGVRLVPVTPGTARNTVNVAVFRKHSLFTHGDTQFAAC